MINSTVSPQTAASRALGMNPYADTSLAVRTRFREAVEKRNLNPFRLVQIAFYDELPAIAAINVMRHFAGVACPWVGADSSQPLFDGFYRRGLEGNLFLRNSADYEPKAAFLKEEGDSLFDEITAAGVNPVQAREVQTMGTSTSLILSGSVVDYFELHRCLSPLTNNAHPDARRFAREVWECIRLEYPDIGAVFEETGL